VAEPLIGAVGGKALQPSAPTVQPSKLNNPKSTGSPSKTANLKPTGSPSVNKNPNRANTNNNNNTNKSAANKNKNIQSTRAQKGDEPLKLHNQFSDLTQDGEDQMEVEPRTGPGHNKPTAKNK
jgi:hypothetical protein